MSAPPTIYESAGEQDWVFSLFETEEQIFANLLLEKNMLR